MAMVRKNAERTISERFDEETVVIHIERGTYFSLRGAAVDIWCMLDGGASREAMLAALASLYPDAPSDISSAVDRTLALLTAEDLICECDDETDQRGALVGAAAGGEYVEPTVEVYHDLQELIAIDPVHEVDPMQGWPQRPPTFPRL